MTQQILAIFSGGEAIVATAIGILIVLIKALLSIGRALDFHDKHFVEKHRKRLLDLRASMTGDNRLAQYLDESIMLEAFRIASGIRAPSLKAYALIKLSALGYWSREQIRQISNYLVVTPDHPLPAIQIRKTDKIEAWYSLLSGVIFILMGTFIWIAIALKHTPYGAVIGLIPFVGMTLVGLLFSTTYRNYKLAQRVQKFLNSHSEIFQTTTPYEAPRDIPSRHPA